ncbi:MAG: hypothetical protein IPK79_00180 [Vampirovibrionales bacterium]|nr:hypothetical protein [Vampirovibrionales bacterium]
MKCTRGHMHSSDRHDPNCADRVIGGVCGRRTGKKQCGAILHLVQDDNGASPSFVVGRLDAGALRAHIALDAPVVGRSRRRLALCRRDMLTLEASGMDGAQIAAYISTRDDLCAHCVRIFAAVYGGEA